MEVPEIGALRFTPASLAILATYARPMTVQIEVSNKFFGVNLPFAMSNSSLHALAKDLIDQSVYAAKQFQVQRRNFPKGEPHPREEEFREDMRKVARALRALAPEAVDELARALVTTTHG